MHFEIADHVLDIAENAVEARPALVRVELDESPLGLAVAVEDDGRGMDADEARRALDPFWSDGKHAARRVGLGLPFLVQGVEQAGGAFRLESERGKGTRVAFSFPATGPDVPPTGDMASLIAALVSLPGDHEMLVRRRRTAPDFPLDYEIARSELAEALGGLERADSLLLLRDYLRSQEEDRDIPTQE